MKRASIPLPINLGSSRSIDKLIRSVNIELFSDIRTATDQKTEEVGAEGEIVKVEAKKYRKQGRVMILCTFMILI